MSDINVSALRPVGEFGSKPWCEACAKYGVQLLQAVDIPRDLAWGFSEIYTHAPARLLEDGREMAAYHIMVRDGEVTGGDGAPEECRALRGFHVAIPWAAICNQSSSKYGREGQRQRSAEEAVMYADIEAHVGRPDPLGKGSGPEWWFPDPIGSGLGAGSEEGGGLHNIAASLQAPSPEFDGMPTTELRVPIFSKMTDAQKAAFLELLGVED